MINQIEARREMVRARFEHSWNKSNRLPISVKEYRALLDLWEAVEAMKEESLKEEIWYIGISCHFAEDVDKALEKLQKI